ncbi:MAG: outer membrane beta-barrel protein [Bacteroidota bacterium]
MKKALVISILFVLFGQLTYAQADTVTVSFGENSKFIMLVDNKDDLDDLKKLDLNRLIRDIERYLYRKGSVPSDSTVTIKGEDGEPIVVNFEDVSDYDDDGVKIYMNLGGGDNDPEEEDDIEAIEFELDLGLNTYLNSDGQAPDGTDYDLRMWGSRYIAINFISNFRLAKKRSKYPVYLKTGVSFSWYNFMFENDVRAVKGEDEILFVPSDVDYRKTKLVASYLNLPVSIQFGNHERNWFSFAVGGYAGLRLGSHDKVVTREDGERTKQKAHNDFHLTNFRYGVQGELNLGRSRGFSPTLFMNYDLNNLFRDNRGPELNALSFGIRI